MEELFAWLSKIDPKIAITVLCLILAITIIVKWETVAPLFKWITGRSLKRSCGDCVLILFAIREKYESDIYNVEKHILKSQMVYFEQKEIEIVQKFTESFRNDIELKSDDHTVALKIAQINNYQEAMKNSLSYVKDELRRSFKENGFCDFSDSDYSTYVKSKTKTFISIVQSYLSTYYTNTESLVNMKHRFNKLNTNEIESIAFDVYNNARAVYKDSKDKIAKLKEEFKADIDAFVTNPRSR